MSDRDATQEFAIFNVLINYTGQRMTSDVVDRIKSDIVAEMRTGSCAWAFKPGGNLPK